jgi:hypothetical protein
LDQGIRAAIGVGPGESRHHATTSAGDGECIMPGRRPSRQGERTATTAVLGLSAGPTEGDAHVKKRSRRRRAPPARILTPPGRARSVWRARSRVDDR